MYLSVRCFVFLTTYLYHHAQIQECQPLLRLLPLCRASFRLRRSCSLCKSLRHPDKPEKCNFRKEDFLGGRYWPAKICRILLLQEWQCVEEEAPNWNLYFWKKVIQKYYLSFKLEQSKKFNLSFRITMCFEKFIHNNYFLFDNRKMLKSSFYNFLFFYLE